MAQIIEYKIVWHLFGKEWLYGFNYLLAGEKGGLKNFNEQNFCYSATEKGRGFNTFGGCINYSNSWMWFFTRRNLPFSPNFTQDENFRNLM